MHSDEWDLCAGKTCICFKYFWKALFLDKCLRCCFWNMCILAVSYGFIQIHTVKGVFTDYMAAPGGYLSDFLWSHTDEW